LTVKTASPSWHFVGAIAAWLVPGAGHLMLGQKGRAAILFAAIGLLWLGGLFVGGPTVFDRKGHPIWFIGQMLIAPSILVEGYHRSLQGPAGEPPRPDDTAGLYQPSYGHVHEQGVLYTSLAGMLNLLAMMDVLYRDPADPRHRGHRGHSSREPESAQGNGDAVNGAENGGAIAAETGPNNGGGTI
jgi:uncharacterized protein DUF6677